MDSNTRIKNLCLLIIIRGEKYNTMRAELTNEKGLMSDSQGLVILIIGADDGIRTRDPQLGKLMLYQLSYVRIDG